MSSELLNFTYIGWCNDTKNGVTSDKVWASFTVNNSHYACWGARGKTVNFKKHDSAWSLGQVQRKKENEYKEVDESKLLEIWPDFYESVEMRLSFCILADKIK
jgi:hypothetical protein